ncbi:hypothetical protein ADT71_09540 [Novosphingobium sp. ST904]|nr:hypothetical protein ADT71_09540 [Novosphingobium sp. ST904]
MPPDLDRLGAAIRRRDQREGSLRLPHLAKVKEAVDPQDARFAVSGILAIEIVEECEGGALPAILAGLLDKHEVKRPG